MVCQYNDTPLKKMFQARHPVKKIILIVFLYMKWLITIDILEKKKCIAVNIARLLRSP